MPMPTYRNTNYSALYALLGMVLICIMSIASPVFRTVINNLVGSTVLREFKTDFQDVHHPADTERLSLQTKMGEFAAGEPGCDFFVGEVRTNYVNDKFNLASYADQVTNGNPLQVLVLEGGRIPATLSGSLPEPLDDLAGWELPPGAEQSLLYMVYVIIVDYETDLSLDCR